MLLTMVLIHTLCSAGDASALSQGSRLYILQARMVSKSKSGIGSGHALKLYF